MNTPFVNDMFSYVYKAFKNLYPSKECEVQWIPDNLEENGEQRFGCTTFGNVTMVEVSASIAVKDAVEVLAHELAHVAVGIKDGHGKEWNDAFNAIFNEYERLLIWEETNEHRS